MEQEIAQLNDRIKLLENLLFRFVKNDKYYFDKHIVLADGVNISASSGTGSSLGAATDKLSVYRETPVVQAGAISAPTGGGTQDAEARTAINSIRTALTNFGITG